MICPLHEDHEFKWDDFEKKILLCTRCGAKLQVLEDGN